jgi:hypothetical protein
LTGERSGNPAADRPQWRPEDSQDRRHRPGHDQQRHRPARRLGIDADTIGTTPANRPVKLIAEDAPIIKEAIT